jgi:tetrapyrrole methylase family protein/MazG family protein
MARVVVVGLGPAGPDAVTIEALAAIDAVRVRFVRTTRHPAAAVVPSPISFDSVYEQTGDLEDVYRTIVDRLVGAAMCEGDVLYAVPGSPLVAERTVDLLRADPRVDVRIVPGLSYLDLAWGALGIDPLACGVRLVDGRRFAQEAAGERGPLLVGQCDSRFVLSDIKLAFDGEPPPAVTVLQRLGLDDQLIATMPWDELDRLVEPDHLTSLWIPVVAEPVGASLVRFHELVRRLRVECPWDREQTHRSLTRHLIEECHEAVEAIDALDPDDPDTTDHLADELGDVLFQVFFHAVLGEEAGEFTLTDVADAIHDKLVRRHPHVFGSVEAHTTDAVLANWEELKRAERQASSRMSGITKGLPALLEATKVQERAAGAGFDWVDVHGALPKAHEELDELVAAIASDDADAPGDELGDVLFAVVNVARHLGTDAEAALRSATAKFRRRFEAVELLADERGLDLSSMDLAAMDALWDEVKRNERAGR